MAIILCLSGDELIGLRAYFIVDDDRTLISRGERIHPEFRGQGLIKQLREYARKHAKEHFPNLQRMRLTTTFDHVNAQDQRRISEWDIVSYQVEKKSCSRLLASFTNSVEIKQCYREYFSNIILSSPVRSNLFPNNLFLVNWCPFEPLRSNVDHILQESSECFAEKCTDDAFPGSFSFATHSPRVKFVQWLVAVYTSDSDLFEAHLLHQLKRACEFISADFVFISFQDKSFTELAKKLLEKHLQLKTCEYYHNQTIKLYEKNFTT